MCMNDKVAIVVAEANDMAGDWANSYAGGSIGKLYREGFKIVRCILDNRNLNDITRNAWRHVYGVEEFPLVSTAEDVQRIAKECRAKYVIAPASSESCVSTVYSNPADGIYYYRDKSPNCLINILDALDLKLKFIDMCALNFGYLGQRYLSLYSKEYIHMLLPRTLALDMTTEDGQARLGAEAMKLWVLGLATHRYDCPCWTPTESFRLNLGIDLPPLQTTVDFEYPGDALKDHWMRKEDA
jgi:hypothetical protein